MGTVIPPDKFSKTLQDVIRMYGNDVASATITILEETGEDAKNKLRTTNWGWKTRSGKYQKSFRVELRKTRIGATATVYAAAPYYRRTHLLEKGHRNPKAGTGKHPRPGAKKETKAFKHWSIVEEYAVKELEERLLTGLLDVGAR